jgi:hypothetical protein
MLKQLNPTETTDASDAYKQLIIPIRYSELPFRADLTPTFYPVTRKSEAERQNFDDGCHGPIKKFDQVLDGEDLYRGDASELDVMPAKPQDKPGLTLYHISLPVQEMWQEACGYQLIYVEWPDGTGLTNWVCDFSKTPTCSFIEAE